MIITCIGRPMKADIAVIVAHPDDEVLACGGVIARHAANGDTVRTLILATGATARRSAGAAAIARLKDHACEAAAILGCPEPAFGDFPDNRMDTVPLLDIVQRVEAFLGEAEPETLFTHHQGDLNIDHRITARAVLTACRPLPGASWRRLYGCEVLSSSEYAAPENRFRPNSYVGIESALDQKCRALAAYADEVRAWPHPRSPQAVRHQAALRGSECGLGAAEAFCLLRQIVP